MTDTAGENNASTMLLLHCNEDLGATTFVDRAVGGSAKTITALEDAQIERTPKFGFGAIGMHGAGSFVKIDSTDDFDFGLDDLAIEFWANLRDPVRAHLFAMAADDGGSPDPDNMLAIERVGSQGDTVSFRVRYRIGGVDLVALTATAFVDLIGAHHHIVLTRVDTQLLLYIDGAEALDVTATDVNGGPLDIDCSGWDTYIGASFEDAEFRTADALFDEVRIQAETVWSAAFTPPTGPYTRRQLSRAVGRSTVRMRHQSRAVGQSGVILRHYRSRAVGVSVVRSRHESRAVGVSGVQQRHQSRAVGVSDVILHRHRSRAVGVSAVRVGHQSRAVGQSRILTTRHLSRAVGTSSVRNRYESRAVGTSRVLARYESRAVGTSRIAESAAARYELYHGIGSIDFTAAPLATSPTLPFDVAISGAGVHYLVVRQRNQYGELSGNISVTKIELDGANEEIQVVPTAPEWIEAEAAPGETVRVKAHYAYPIDADLAADTFRVYRKIDHGTMDYTASASMVKTDGLARLDWTSTETFGTSKVYVEVRAQRSSDGRESDAIAAMMVDFLIASQAPGSPGIVQVEHF